VSADKLAASETCRELLGREPDTIETPGGKTRDSVRARFGAQSLIVTHRKQEQRARLEALVLRALNESSAPAPRLIAWRGAWLLQQDMGTQRLSEALHGSDAGAVVDRLHEAITGLVHCQRAGREQGLEQQLVVLGKNRPWFDKLLARRHAVGDLLDIAPPELPEEDLVTLLRVREPGFIKWDARPGNAIVGAGGEVYWIDWEHCGCRNPLDDLVWLLADEYTPTTAVIETQLLDTWLKPFSEGWVPGEAQDYFYSYGVLHGMVRLHYILRHKGDGPWWNPAVCLSGDKVGVTREYALCVTAKMRRWTAQSTLLGVLGPWLEQVESSLPLS
jgi:hypothetical protein